MMESNHSCGVTTLPCCFDSCCWGCPTLAYIDCAGFKI